MCDGTANLNFFAMADGPYQYACPSGREGRKLQCYVRDTVLICSRMIDKRAKARAKYFYHHLGSIDNASLTPLRYHDGDSAIRATAKGIAAQKLEAEFVAVGPFNPG